jgi:hypothetical protein
MSDLPHKRGELPKGIHEADEATQMAKFDNEWELIDSGEVASRMVAAMAEAHALEPTYELWLDWPNWREAFLVELDNLKAARTWELVERPPNTNIVNSKLVFCVKKDAEGNILKWKA